MIKSAKIGKLPPRYSFILNAHEGTRLSKCPRCEKLTYPRKFAFLLQVDGWGRWRWEKPASIARDVS